MPEMYDADVTMNNIQQQQRSQIEGEEDDDVAGGESIDNPNSIIQYDEMNGVDPHALYVPPVSVSDVTPVATGGGGGGADQLTLSFQGEVYVFDSVLPEKVKHPIKGPSGFLAYFVVLFLIFINKESVKFMMACFFIGYSLFAFCL